MLYKMSQLAIISKAENNGIESLSKDELKVYRGIEQDLIEIWDTTIEEEFFHKKPQSNKREVI